MSSYVPSRAQCARSVVRAARVVALAIAGLTVGCAMMEGGSSADPATDPATGAAPLRLEIAPLVGGGTALRGR